MDAVAYEFRVLDPRSLADLGEIRPQDVISAEWQRHELEVGSWRLAVPRRLVDPTLIARQNLLDVRRNGAREFVGIIEARDLDRIGETWVLAGPDLKGWLRRRVVAAETPDPKSGKAETVAKEYVDENLGPSAAAARRGSTELTSGKTWTVEATIGRGPDVDYQATRAFLDDVVSDVLQDSGLYYDVVLTSAGYELQVYAVTDATVGTGAVPFSVGFDNVEALAYREDYRRTANVLYVMGEGSGASRTIREVRDDASVALDFRREGLFDSRNASTNDELDQAGATEVARQLLASVNADVVPLQTAVGAAYRDDWDVGQEVTIALPLVGVEIDRRIVGASIKLGEGAVVETAAMSLGVMHARSQLRRIGDALAQLRRASNQ